ncbi:YIP1 family protein [Nocardiopsis sp. LOL_012]|uniref:YIP1 family protein n=1 Tax=Nocardiopsis sp. LOL_012 TaxID=3345409 RepID=UPI003A84687B
MLRHLVGLLAGIALAPPLWAALAWGADLFPRLAGGEVTAATVSAAIVLALAGAIGAYLAAGGASPLCAAAAGLLLTALALWPVLSPQTVATALGWLDPEGFLYPVGPGLAPALAAGVLLLGSAMTPTRWRVRRTAAEPPPAADGPAPGRDRVRDGGPLPTRPLPAEPAGERFSDTPPLPPTGSGDPDKTTTPFRRQGDPASRHPLDVAPEQFRSFDDRS